MTGLVRSRAAFDAGTGPDGAIMIGSAAEITEKLLTAKKALGLDRIFAQIDWGALPPGMVQESGAGYPLQSGPTSPAASEHVMKSPG
jgi:hypothetical protein